MKDLTKQLKNFLGARFTKKGWHVIELVYFQYSLFYLIKVTIRVYTLMYIFFFCFWHYEEFN